MQTTFSGACRPGHYQNNSWEPLKMSVIFIWKNFLGVTRGTEITSNRPFAIYMPALAWEDVTSPPQDLGLDLGFGRPWARPGTSIGKMPGPRAGSRGSPSPVALGLHSFGLSAIGALGWVSLDCGSLRIEIALLMIALGQPICSFCLHSGRVGRFVGDVVVEWWAWENLRASIAEALCGSLCSSNLWIWSLGHWRCG